MSEKTDYTEKHGLAHLIAIGRRGNLTPAGWDELEKTIYRLELELGKRRDIAERFTAHANAIWNAAFPDDKNGWEYGAQLERCVIDRIGDLQAERDKYASLYPSVAKVEALEAEKVRRDLALDSIRDLVNTTTDATDEEYSLSFMAIRSTLELYGLE